MSKKHKKSGNSTTHAQEKILPRAFFLRVGVKPFIDPNDQLLHRVVKKKMGKEIADELYDLVDNRKDFGAAMYLSFAHLELAKLWYGNNLIETCKIAEELDTVSVPANAKILDIGGGPGLLAFWMTHIWENCHVTVADKSPEVGTKWAKEIGIDRVTFVNSVLPDLKNIPDQIYDVVVMSRVLPYLDDLDMPIFLNTHNVADYPDSEDGRGFFLRFGNLIDKIKRVLAPNGHLVIISEWTDIRVFLICKAMEQKGLFIDSEVFNCERLSREFSVIVFSALKKMPDHSMDLSMGMLLHSTFLKHPFL